MGQWSSRAHTSVCLSPLSLTRFTLEGRIPPTVTALRPSDFDLHDACPPYFSVQRLTSTHLLLSLSLSPEPSTKEMQACPGGGGGAVFGGAGPWSTQASSSVTTFLVSAEGTRGGRNHPELRWNPTGTLVLCYFLVMLCYFLVAVSRILGRKYHRKEGQEPGPLVSCLHSQEAGRDECWRPAVFLLLNFNLGPTPQDGDLQPQPTGC